MWSENDFGSYKKRATKLEKVDECGAKFEKKMVKISQILVPELNQALTLLNSIKGNKDKVRQIRECLIGASKRYEIHIKFLTHSNFKEETINKVEFKDVKDTIEYKEKFYSDLFVQK